MSIIKLASSLVWISMIVLLTESCRMKDPCEAIFCENGGICEEGICECLDGFVGINCEDFDKTKTQILLDIGFTPIALYNGGVPLDSLYGKMYFEGLIFNLDTLNGGGMVTAPEDQGTEVEWGCRGTNLLELNDVIFCAYDCYVPEPEETILGARIGDGKTNTDAIIESCMTDSIAAKLCRSLGVDWFLPSRGELILMNENLHLRGLGGFAPDIYWSSTEYDDSRAWFQVFYVSLYDYHDKDFTVHVRAIRTF